MRSKEEIRQAIDVVNGNKELTHGYRDDVTDVLNWVLGEKEFDGLTVAEKKVELIGVIVSGTVTAYKNEASIEIVNGNVTCISMDKKLFRPDND